MRCRRGQPPIRDHGKGGSIGRPYAIVPYCREIEEFDPDLTLKGFLALYEMNASG